MCPYPLWASNFTVRNLFWRKNKKWVENVCPSPSTALGFPPNSGAFSSSLWLIFLYLISKYWGTEDQNLALLLVLTLSLRELLLFQSFKSHLYTLMTSRFMNSVLCFPELQAFLSDCLLIFCTWIFNKHLQLNRFQIKVLVPLPNLPLPCLTFSANYSDIYPIV